MRWHHQTRPSQTIAQFGNAKMFTAWSSKQHRQMDFADLNQI
jgi:hypothetical protein